jgi:UDP-glucose 4-epimerase
MAKILVTGGLGYIGSHTAVSLIEAGHEVVLLDNLSNSSLAVLEGITDITGVIPSFFKTDLRDPNTVINLFKKHSDIVGIIHFAAFKAVGTSLEKQFKHARVFAAGSCKKKNGIHF